MPTSTTVAPGLDHVRGDQARHARRGDHDVRRRVCAARSRVPVWHRVTVAFSLTAGQQQAQRAADRGAAADHGDLGAVQRYVVAAQQVHDAARRAGQRAGEAEHEPAQVDRVQAVGVLVRVDQLQHPAGVEVLAAAAAGRCSRGSRVGVELGDDRLDVLLGGVGGQVAADRGDAHLGAVAVLAVDVRVRAGSSPTSTVPRPGTMPRSRERLHPRPQVVLDRGRGGLAVQNRRRHVGPFSTESPRRRTPSRTAPPAPGRSSRR